MAQHRGVDRKEDKMNEVARKLFDEGLGDSRIRSVSWRGNDFVVELALPPGHDEEPNLFLRG